jgi:integrase
MATFVKVGNRWRAQIRQKGHPATSKNFSTKALAVQWARAMEADLDAGRSRTEPPKPTTTVSELVDRYINEVSAAKPFGRNKADVLKKIKELLGSEIAGNLTAERVVDYIRKDRGIRDVTATIDLTYLKGVLKIARALWREPVQPSVVDDAREILRYMGSLNRANERDRRPTPDELDALRDWFALRSHSLTPDIFDFILASCFRPPSEVVRLRWEDLNHDDRTIVIHDRKDPRKKIGNHQTVPLLHGAYDIVMRQHQVSEFIFPVNGHSWSTLFPRACRELEIEDLRLYDLRHEAISRLVESKKHSFPEMMLITGHKDPKQLMRYTQLRARDLHR